MERFEVDTYRGVGNYLIEGLSNWVSITGSNSTNKSTLISAISLLGSNKMHETSDIPTQISPTRISPKEISVKLSYLFRLSSGFAELIMDKRLPEFLIQTKQYFSARKPTTDDSFTKSLEMEIDRIKSKPLVEIFFDALYDTLKEFQAKHYDPSFYERFLYSPGATKPVKDVVANAKYLRIDLDLSIADGPSHRLFLLDKDKQEIVSDEIFYFWLKNTHAVDIMDFALVIGAIFIKCVENRPFYQEESSLPPSVMSSDGSNIEQFIKYCLEYAPDLLDRIAKDFKKIFGRNIRIKIPATGGYSDRTKIIVKLGEEDDWFPLERLSDGMINTLKVLLQLHSCRNGDILVIDEPELHLHPGAAKSLRKLLYDKKSENQIICSTHSPIFINPAYVDTIIVHKLKEKPQTLESEQIDAALIALGSSGSDAILYDVVIWYEGPSDKLYLEKWLQLFSSELKIEFSDIGLMHFGGIGNLKHVNPEIVKKIARNSIFVLDSDKKAKNDCLNGRTKSFLEECKKNNIHCWVTNRREIENYVPLTILTKICNISDTSLQIGPYDNVFEKLQKEEDGEKIKLARSATRMMTLEQMQKDNEFQNELRTELINVINSFFQNAA